MTIFAQGTSTRVQILASMIAASLAVLGIRGMPTLLDTMIARIFASASTVALVYTVRTQLVLIIRKASRP